jgi:outer membrane lipoprotein-sorting protein
MAGANRRIAAALLSLAALTSAAYAGQDERAAELLRKSMGRHFPVNVVSVILQRDPAGDGTYQRVKISRARDGRSRHTTLQPLRMAGVEQVDNGEELRMYLPDKRAVIVQDSPHRMASDLEERITLAKRNYDFSLSPGERIAGRTTVCIVADPKAPDMAVRRYYLDEKNGYPLKMEMTSERGKVKVVFDTIAIDYPPSLSNGVFQFTPLPGTTTIRYTRPKPLNSQGQAQAVVGFRPVVPERLPMGFRVQEMQYNDGKQWKSIMFRLSDGLARATVYQWKSNVEVEAMEDSSRMEVNGLKLMVVSDLPAPVRMRLLQAFVGQANSEDAPRAMRLIGMLTPALPSAVRDPELWAALWTFAQIDGRAGLGDLCPATGVHPLK